MHKELISQLIELAFVAIISTATWRYYRNRTSLRFERYSTIGPRLWGGWVDYLVLWPVGFLRVGISLLHLPRPVAATHLCVAGIPYLLYRLLLHAKRGQTVGKMVTHVRVVDNRSEGPITLRQAIVREGVPFILSIWMTIIQVGATLHGTFNPGENLATQPLIHDRTYWVALAIPGVWMLADIITIFTNDKRRALHDFIAGTIVVRTNAEDSGA